MAALNILKKRNDFRRVYSGGKFLADRILVIYFKKNNLGSSRFGFTVSKKVGGAVERNRIRRVLKEICRLNKEKFVCGMDYVIVARRGIISKSYQKISEVLFINLKKIK